MKACTRRIFSGIQPTGVPHLGNYLGALKQWVTLQDTGKAIYCIVDLHAITVPQRTTQLTQWKREMLASLLAIGIDPAKSTLYYQSSVREHTELSWLLSTVAQTGQLQRMTQFKEKQSQASSSLALFAYPVLQAADILLYKSTFVPVGEDQSQHLELCRSLAKLMNSRMARDVFPKPEGGFTSTPRIRSLRDPRLKMSKSAKDEKSRISVIDSGDEIRRKIMGAVTDSIDGVSYDPERLGISNLIDVYSHMDGIPVDEAVSRCSGLSHRAFKELVADSVVRHLEPIRERYLALDVDSERGQRALDEIAARGGDEARAIAQSTMAEVRPLMGLS